MATLKELFPDLTTVHPMQSRLDSHGVTADEFIQQVVEGRTTHGPFPPEIAKHGQEQCIWFLSEFGGAYIATVIAQTYEYK